MPTWAQWCIVWVDFVHWLDSRALEDRLSLCPVMFFISIIPQWLCFYFFLAFSWLSEKPILEKSTRAEDDKPSLNAKGCFPWRAGGCAKVRGYSLVSCLPSPLCLLTPILFHFLLYSSASQSYSLVSFFHCRFVCWLLLYCCFVGSFSGCIFLPPNCIH
jgi:hypothetical protein